MTVLSYYGMPETCCVEEAPLINQPSRSLKIKRPEKTLRELTLEQMRTAIIDGHFKPNERLVERDLCDQLGVSRTIVREVLRHLESEGLVSTGGTRGPVVAQTTTSQAIQIYEIRGVLEGMAASACADHSARKTIADGLQAALERIKAGYERRDMEAVLTETAEFYRQLFEGADRDVAWDIVCSLTARITRLRAMTIRSPERGRDGPAQMQRIVDAIRAGRSADAHGAAQAHIGNAMAIARRLLAENPSADESH
jgi:GntR family transcriptional regulator, trigonelline degradation regulator